MVRQVNYQKRIKELKEELEKAPDHEGMKLHLKRLQTEMEFYDL